MKHKKIWAMTLSVVMALGFLPKGALANPQKPIQEIQKVTVTSELNATAGSQGELMPRVQIDWLAPLKNDKPAQSDPNIDKDREEFYVINVENVYDGGNQSTDKEIPLDKIQENNGVMSIKMQDHFSSILRSGSLYATEIIAKHRHQIVDPNGNSTWVDAPSASPNTPTAYYITDFNIQANTEDGLVFEWEYIPDVHYKLFYDKGNFTDIAGMSGAGINITPEQAKANLSTDGKRVVWKVGEASAGQIYSAYVVPTGIDNKGIEFESIAYNQTTPKIVRATPNIKLNIDPLGQDKIRLSWNIKDAAWVQVDNKLYQTVIWEINEKGEEKELGRIQNDNFGNKDVGYFEAPAPEKTMTYRVDFILKNSTGTIEKAFSAGPREYTPDESKEVPFQPYIPELFRYNEDDVLNNEDVTNQSKYKVKFNGKYDDLVLAQNNIKDFKEHTFHYKINGNQAEIQVVWDAPKDSKTGEIDYSLYYDIWISERADLFLDSDKVVGNLKVEENSKDNLILMQDNQSVVGFKTTITGLKPNKTYYIKMVSKRAYSNDSYAISLPTIKEVSIDKVGDIYTPPVIGKPPLQMDEVTKNSIGIKWTEEWYEIMTKPGKESLYDGNEVEKKFAKWGSSRVYLDKSKSPVLRFIRDNEKIEAIDLYGDSKLVESKLNQIEQALGSDMNNYIKQYVKAGKGTGYKIKVMKQSEVEAQKGEQSLEEWVQSIDKSEIKGWQDITGNLESIMLSGIDGKKFTITNDYQGNPLDPNTPYIILVTAYRNVDGEDLYSAFPSFLLGTTSNDHISDPEVPTTPRLYNYEEKDVRDTEITVRWIYNDNFEYQLVYSRLNDPDSATVWEMTEEDKKTFVDGAEAYVTVKGLLPETTYNFWLKAIQKQDKLPEGVTAQESDWSTPVTSTTKTLETPPPPSGLGLASYQSIQEAGQDFKPKGSDYLTIEWTKNENDNPETLDERISYSYEVEFADNVEFLDAVVVRTGDEASEEGNNNNNNGENENDEAIGYEIISKNIVKFTNLRANMPYYVRVKTILTFKDGDKVIIKESVFSKWVRLLTSTSTDEYDGGENENIIIYPNEMEESYKDGIWTYEIVDTAKVINRIQEDKKYFFTITLENYKNKHDAKVRRIKMPKEIMDTLSNQGMALQVITNIGVYEIPGKALNYYLSQHNATDSVQFDLTRMEYSEIESYARSGPEQYQSGEKIDIRINGDIKKTVVNKLDGAMKVKLKLDVIQSYNYINFFTYQYNYSSGNWQSYAHEVDVTDNSYLVYSTSYTGLNAVYERSVVDGSLNSNYAMNQLTSTYNIIGLGSTYRKDTNVGASEYVSLMLALSLNREGVNLSAGASTDDYNKAKIAGLYISNNRGYITKEQALVGAVKLYELKNRYQIKPSNLAFNNVSSNYRQIASKAYAIGLIGETLVNPQGTITYGELCDWLIQVIE